MISPFRGDSEKREKIIAFKSVRPIVCVSHISSRKGKQSSSRLCIAMILAQMVRYGKMVRWGVESNPEMTSFFREQLHPRASGMIKCVFGHRACNVVGVDLLFEIFFSFRIEHVM